MNPRDRELRCRLSEARTDKEGLHGRIAILCLPGLESVLKDIVAFLERRYEVRTCYSREGKEFEAAIRWADVVWIEWANELAEALTRREGLLDQKPVICRIHSYEVLSGYLPRIDWSKITKAIFVADHVLSIARDLYPPLDEKTVPVVIPNGVNLERFPFKKRKPGFNIAVVGYVNHKKNPALWPEILNRLTSIDKRYHIKIAGGHQDARYLYYLDHILKNLELAEHMKFFGHVDDIAGWFESERINYLLSTSPFESFGYAIAEAMAMGFRPLIHAFPGSDTLWPKNCLFSSICELFTITTDDDGYNS
jgi:glycosyltransferase involved in cell wall biosynthesis